MGAPGPRARILIDARKAADFGIGRYIVGLLGGLCRLDELELFAVARPEDLGLFPAEVTPVLSRAPHYSLSELTAVRYAIWKVQPDVFHAPHYVVPFWPPRATVVTVHDLMHLNRPEHASWAKTLYARTMVRRAVRSAARMIAGSAATLRELAAVDSFDARALARSRVISYGIDDRFSPRIDELERARVRSAHRLPGPYLLFLGNDKPHKNWQGLLTAFALYAGRVPSPYRLVLAGGSRETAGERRREIEARGLGGLVDDLGRVPDEDVPGLLVEARALALPSFTEGYGLPVVEAQSCGTPVVCSDRGGLAEAAGDAALIVDPESSEDMAAGLARILDDEPLRARLVALGLERSRELSWDSVARKTTEVYGEVLRETRRTGP
jgi:alpha-1,3-rhamnosyl/mannosyltransferase